MTTPPSGSPTRQASGPRATRARRTRSRALQNGGESPPLNPPVSRGGASLPEPHPPDADQGGPDRARERRGPHCIRSVRRGPRAGLPARRFGGVPPPSSPCFAPCQVGRFGLHAQSSHPPPERVTGNPLRTPAAAGGADAAPAGPGNAVRPQSRGREGRRPRNGRRTPALATAHPAGLKGGPARRVRLSQIPASRTGANEERAPAAERPGRRISAFHLDGAGKKRGFAAGRHFLPTTTAVPDERTALSGRPA